MKKLSLLLVAAIAAVAMCFCFAGCSNPDPVGVWKFQVMSADAGGLKLKYEAGKTYLYGQLTFSEDSVVLEIKDDYTWTMSTDLFGEAATESGTWEVKSGKVLLTDSNGETDEATVKGNELTLSEEIDGVKYKMQLIKSEA